MSGSEKKSEQEHVRPFLQKNMKLRSFWKFHIVVVQNNGKEMCKKNLLHMQNCFFADYTPIVVFHRSLALPSLFTITPFYILFKQTINIIESFALSPG